MICDNCKGTGKVKQYEVIRRILVEKEVECSKCNGTGEIPEQKNKTEKTENIEG
jgi:DnaJ-class molecular chaperone